MNDNLPEGWRKVLSARSVKDKIGVVIDCDLCPVGELNVVAELVREGLIEWIERACLRHLGVGTPDGKLIRRGVNADVYRLTPKGIALCEANGIKQH